MTVHCDRAENVLENLPVPDAVSARAVAPLTVILEWLEPLLRKGTTAYLHKGLDFEQEWKSFRHQHRFDLLVHKSRIGPGVIAEVRANSAKNHLET